MTKNIVVMYHGECKDGFGGAFAAWLKFGNKAEYIGVQHRNPPPEGLKNKEIYFIDFVYKPEVMRQIAAKNKKVIAIDHHVTAKESIDLVHESLYRMENSGSVLAWEYFHPAKPVPKLLLYIQDNDIWTFKVPKSREVFMYLNTVPWDFKEWKRLMVRLEKSETRKKMIEKGAAILDFEKSMVESLIKNSAELVEFEGRRIYAVNSPVAVSDIGHELSKKHPPMAIIWSERDGKTVVSMRSDGSVDVAQLAIKYGGGGHKAAAAFSLDIDEPKPWKIIR
jgi:nanoRNase/pAp phosphatase (c-di-AMP/oligoRNAs hydrolase)